MLDPLVTFLYTAEKRRGEGRGGAEKGLRWNKIRLFLHDTAYTCMYILYTSRRIGLAYTKNVMGFNLKLGKFENLTSLNIYRKNGYQTGMDIASQFHTFIYMYIYRSIRKLEKHFRLLRPLIKPHYKPVFR